MYTLFNFIIALIFLTQISSCVREQEVLCDSGSSKKDCLEKFSNGPEELPVSDVENNDSLDIDKIEDIKEIEEEVTDGMPEEVTSVVEVNKPNLLLFIASASCVEGDDPHWQCAGRWKQLSSISENDFVGICPDREAENYLNCYAEDKYIQYAKISTLDGVLVCSGFALEGSSRSGCDHIVYARKENFYNLVSLLPPETSDEIEAIEPVSSNESSILSFTDVTLSAFPDLLPGQVPVPAAFEADLGHIDNDGCLDAHITSHTTDAADGVYLQNNIDGVCQGNFSYLSNNYSATSAINRRITSWFMIFDLNNDGRNDFIGGDVDGNPSLAAIQSDNTSFTPTTGCLFSVDRCLPFDMNGDGDLELIGAPLVGVNFNDSVVNKPVGAAVFNSVYAWPEGTVLWQPNWGNLVVPNLTRAWSTSLVFDANNDGYPDLVNPQLNLIWFNGIGGLGSGIYGNFSAHATLFDNSYTEDAEKHSNVHQQIFLDYDNDGDMDIFKIRVNKGGNQSIDLADMDNDGDGIFLLQNDGSGIFTDVSRIELAGINLTSLTYQTTYAGVGAGDFNNDGLTDIRVDWLAGSFTNTCAVLVNGGSGKWTRESFACEYVGSTKNGRVPVTGGAAKTVFTHGDYDDDGRLDLFSSNAQRNFNKDTLALFRNTGDYGNNWIKFLIRGAPTKDGWHSRVTIRSRGSFPKILCSREIYLAEQFGSLHEHCGLGKHTSVDIELRLPHGGGTVLFNNITVNKQYVLNANASIQEWTAGLGLPAN